MSACPPLLFEPILMPRVWGGRRLAERFGRRLPPDARVGESWELVSLPEAESRVRGGPLAGRTLADCLATFGTDLVGGAPLAEGRFPLLIKLLDARENLSIQVHPRPPREGAWAPGVKHEAWYVIEAERGAEAFIGLRPGVSSEEAARAAGTPRLVDLLQRWPARPGDCFYLPSGTPHALGSGLLVAEIESPSDVTYRMYDWDRTDDAGRSRQLHLEQAAANVRDDVRPEDILQSRSHVAGVLTTTTRLVRCESFMIDRLRVMEGFAGIVPHAEMVIWMVLAGRARVERGADALDVVPGDTLLLPARNEGIVLHALAELDLLEVRVPIASTLRGLPHPPREAPVSPGGVVPLNVRSKPSSG